MSEASHAVGTKSIPNELDSGCPLSPSYENADHYNKSLLGWIPKEWDVKSFGDLASYVNGNSFNVLQWTNVGLPIIRIQNLNGEMDFNYYAGRVDPKWEVQTGGLLFAWSGMRETSFGPRIWKGPLGVLNQHIFKVIPNLSRTTTHFLNLLLRFHLEEIAKSAHGFKSSFVHVTRSELMNVKVPLPPLPQQKKIARILTTVDNLIEKTEALIEKYKAIKQGMMHDLFTRGVDQNGKLRPPYEEAPDLYKKSPLGWIPKEWEQAPLSQYAVVSGGVTLGRKHSNVATVELPYLRVANVQDGYLDLTEIKTIEVLQSEVQRYALEVGDILMTEGGDFDKLGRGTIWLGQISQCLHQNHIFRVRPNPESLDSYFLAAITSSAYGRHYFLMCAKQTTNLASINSTQVKAFPLLLPSLTEQKQIAERLRSIDSQILSEEEQQEKFQLLKNGLMQDLLTGKVRVTVDEAKEVLGYG